MNGFSYDDSTKTIKICNGPDIVVWKFVEKEFAEKAGELYKEGAKELDSFLIKHGCQRFRGG
ncbi:MAG: hypothetical protein LBC27_00510 [Spirochaetaceae bacterium]|jgi:hypothetical protein|nr:hypothetical protein [Spirochaetaceae bacterium]